MNKGENMSDEKKTVELKDEDLEKVTGGDWHCPDIGRRDEPSKQMSSKQIEVGERDKHTHGAGKLS